MGSEWAVKWGPPPLGNVALEQLLKHGFQAADVARVADELATAIGPAARASLFVDLGAGHFINGDVASAMAAWQQAIVSGQVAPSARALYNLALLHHQLGLYDDAISRFDAAIEHGVEPYGALATLAKARTQFDSGDTERAMTTLARLVDNLVEDSVATGLLGQALFGLGSVAEQGGRHERAEHAYRTVMAMGDEHREAAAVALIRVLRFQGHDDEAQQLVVSVGLADHDPVTALDRIELLARLGRVDEAIQAARDFEVDELGAADRFRLAAIHTDLGEVNEAIDILEALAGDGATETRARAAYLLGELYLAHEMIEPARSMFASVRKLDSGYWADRASLALGDLAMSEDKYRVATAHWADAASSRIDTIAESARNRLVTAADRAAEAEQASAAAAASMPGPVGAPAATVEDPTEAVDVVQLLDEEPQAPKAPVIVPLRRSGSSSSIDAAAPRPEPIAPVVTTPAPTTPVVIPLGRDRTASPPSAQPKNLAASVPSQPAQLPGDVIIDLRDRSNPYAELAPAARDDDPAPSERNPYAELAPNFGGDPVDMAAIDIASTTLAPFDAAPADWTPGDRAPVDSVPFDTPDPRPNRETGPGDDGSFSRFA